MDHHERMALLDHQWTIKIEKIIHVKMICFCRLCLWLLSVLWFPLVHHYQEDQFDWKEELNSFGHLDDLRSMLVDNNHMPTERESINKIFRFSNVVYFRSILFNANSTFVTNTQIIQCCGIRTIFCTIFKSFNTELKIS